jgi:anti-sigma-K factor RskA
VEPVNSQFHDEFVTLCALFYSGEISEEEWALLQIHMAYCDSCQERFQQYQMVTADVIPAMAAVAASEASDGRPESASSAEVAERKLMERLNSASVSQNSPRNRKLALWFPIALIATSIVGLVCLIGVYRARSSSESKSQSNLQDSVHEVRPAGSPTATKTETTQDLKQTQDNVAKLLDQLAKSQGRLKQSDDALDGVQKQLASEQAAHKQLSDERDALSQQLAAAKMEIDALSSRTAIATANDNQQPARAEALEAKIRELNTAIEDKDTALSEKDRMLALDTDFLAHDRDIRDLISARNLYIADIFDTTENGKTAKQFGRIFYTKDRSLVFYGFDLDKQAGLRRDVSFQVWGSGSDQPPISLGLFYEDDTNKRWILRCNDAKALARLDMVFVTVEPPGGSTKPTGKKLLRAYLQIPANHP